MKVKKGKVIKEIDNKGLVSDYVSAGWKIVDEKPTENKEVSKKELNLNNEND